jgi:hypothetical protein
MPSFLIRLAEEVPTTTTVLTALAFRETGFSRIVLFSEMFIKLRFTSPIAPLKFLEGLALRAGHCEGATQIIPLPF